MNVSWQQLGIAGGTEDDAREVYDVLLQQKSNGTHRGGYTAQVPSHDVAFIIVHHHQHQPQQSYPPSHSQQSRREQQQDQPPARSSWRFNATLTLPLDTGQPLGTLFEIRDKDGYVLAHAGGMLSEGTYLNNQDRELVFYVAPPRGQPPPPPLWEDLGRPFPETFCETRCGSMNGSLYFFSRDLTSNNVATLSHGRGNASASGVRWQRSTPPAGFPAAWEGTLNTCNGLMSFEEQAILFNGREIYALDTAKYSYMQSSFVSGKVMIYAMSINATHSGVMNSIMIGHWSCSDTNERVKIVAAYDDPTPTDQQWHNDPYTWLATTADADEFLIGANLGDVYLVSETVFRRVHYADFPNKSWQPYTMIRAGERILVGQ